jgi:hypothetical protein
MKKTLFIVATLLASFTMYAQPNADKIMNLKMYLSYMKENIEYAKQYTDSTKMLVQLDSLDAKINRVITDVDKIVIIEEEAIIEPENSYANDAQTDPSVMTEEEQGLTPPPPPAESMVDKFNPLKKMRSSLIVETGINNFNKIGNSLSIDPKVNSGGSWYWNFAFMKQIVSSKAFDLELGFAYQRNRFKFSNDVALVAETDQLSKFEQIANASEDPKLIVSYLNIPLLASVKLSKNFKIIFGGFGGYRVGTSQKIATKTDIEEIEQNRKSNYGLNDWNYGVKAGLGFNNFDVIAQYHLSNLFETNKYYDFRTFMIGTMWKI